jgi:hypothetical protein
MVVTKDDGWHTPRRKPITAKAIDRAIASEAVRTASEHRVRSAWYDRTHDAIILSLRDGRIFGAERTRIPSLTEANSRQLRTLQVTEDGVFLWLPPTDLHISVDGLITRLMESSPATLRRSAAKSVGATASPAKTEAARRNGRLGGRPR